MSRRPPQLSAEDIALWRAVAASVRPLPGRSSPSDPSTAEPERRVPPPDTKSPSPPPARHRPKAAPADRGGERRVRRGQIELWGSIDLHGMTHDRARAAVAVFLHRAAGEGARAVIVVTGKGRYPAPGHGVLKRALPDWLAEANLRGLIAGYAAAHRRHGGDGAYYVFLKRVE